MLALASVWIGLAALALSAAMVVYRPAFTDLTVTLVLYFGAPGSLCLAGLVLWAYRREDRADPGVAAQRKQARVAIVLALVAAVIVYLLVIFSHKLESFDRRASNAYHCAPKGAIVLYDATVHHADHFERPTGNSRLRDDAGAFADAAQA
jgi:heme/copper-type cytochrome/quinol oxidase subunit 2